MSTASPRQFYIENSDTANALLNPTSENLERSALGLLDYFESAVGAILLYKFERPMFNDLHEKLEKEKVEEMENESEAGKCKMDVENHCITGKSLKYLATDEQKPLAEMKRISYSKQFGLPHLLRMFVRFAEMVCSYYLFICKFSICGYEILLYIFGIIDES